jgi:hypothetical protein
MKVFFESFRSKALTKKQAEEVFPVLDRLTEALELISNRHNSPDFASIEERIARQALKECEEKEKDALK